MCLSGEILNIQSASYGRWDTHSCPYHDTNAMQNVACSMDVLSTVTSECASQSTPSSCQLTPTNAMFTDPCQGTYKYLKVEFTCQPGGYKIYVITMLLFTV